MSRLVSPGVGENSKHSCDYSVTYTPSTHDVSTNISSHRLVKCPIEVTHTLRSGTI
ncbi:Uncharacterized protein APZ42_018123 [Daphnia magna]|uniref:Uncharacterized protein n=1 Tax=Daphnia magna TaxID=35525 RepID=A0A164ZBY3_9CRUS|nr:Uncharacterized protein APZ42_018123 [Daphnia magna]